MVYVLVANEPKFDGSNRLAETLKIILQIYIKCERSQPNLKINFFLMHKYLFDL